MEIMTMHKRFWIPKNVLVFPDQNGQIQWCRDCLTLSSELVRQSNQLSCWGRHENSTKTEESITLSVSEEPTLRSNQVGLYLSGLFSVMHDGHILGQKGVGNWHSTLLSCASQTYWQSSSPLQEWGVKLQCAVEACMWLVLQPRPANRSFGVTTDLW